MLGVYIHIPFCKNICSYCDFCKMYYNKKYTNNYLESLAKEIKDRYKNEEIDTLYLGGGTPSSLSIDELKKLFVILKIFKLKKDYEFTFECNIEDINEELLCFLKENGVNRLSIGVQSFNDKYISILNRKHNKEMVFNNIKLAKNYFSNINIDLIYGIDENIEIVKEDLNNFLNLDIPHLSYYSLIIEDNTVLKIKDYDYKDEDVDYKMYKEIEKTLEKNNYIHYEISNYAKDGYYSKHNYNYWLNGDYYGFGLSSVSYLDNKRISNTKNLTKYLNNEFIDNIDVENKRTRQENDCILGLRTLIGINLNDFYIKYNEKVEKVFDIDNLLKDKKLILEEDYLRINKKYFYLANEILIKFLEGEKDE